MPLLSVSASQQTDPTLIVEGGILFDSEKGLGRPLGQLWIAGEHVLAEEPAGTPLPAGVAVINAEGCTVLPGLFDLLQRIQHVVTGQRGLADRRGPLPLLEADRLR
ncbi:MAG: hypothetical protein GY711_10510 [bacterium]|nr:hypothetical protein [bacterium]